VNSTGKKLTLFDLINAKSFQIKNEPYKGGLSDYLTNGIIKAISNNESLKSGVFSFLKYDEDKHRFEKLDKIVRIIEISNLLSREASPAIFKSTMLMRDPEFWFDAWNKKGLQMLETMSWMGDEGLIDIGQSTFLEYAIAIFTANPKSFELIKFKTEIKKYALYLTLSGTGFSKSNLDMVERLYSISKQMSNSHESMKYNYTSPSSSPNLTKEKVLEFTTSGKPFKAIMNIFYIDKANGNFTVDIMGNVIGRELDKHEIDVHHIFPKSRVSNFTNKSLFNSIANTILVDSNANREEIKDKSPGEYFKKINLDMKGSFYCEQNLIDINDVSIVYEEHEADVFIRNRAERIAETVNLYFK